ISAKEGQNHDTDLTAQSKIFIHDEMAPQPLAPPPKLRANHDQGSAIPVMYFSLITGIYDEWLTEEVAAQGIDISPDILYQAGLIIAKKVYRFVHDRGYSLGFIGGGVRGLQHFTEMVGGDVCITMNWQGQAQALLELNPPVVARLFNPVQEHVLDALLTKVPAFREAYMEEGLTVDEYEEYGPVRYFRGMFVSAWENTLDLIAKRRTALRARAAQ
ncbi:MAG TPA: hypothetical protein VLI39_02460, partial [Sedimentisphaerales bacterium]|nr:hypothetical protein [Sedimentisphaerales bacterium]